MIGSQFSNIKIVGIATAVPAGKESVAERYNPVFGEENVAKFSKTTGVVERHVAKEEQCSSDLAYVAAEKLLARGGQSRRNWYLPVCHTDAGLPYSSHSVRIA